MLELYNTLARKKEVFKPIKDKEVGIYSCGPTVYNYVHIGNLRAYVFSDILKKYLKYKGFKVKHVMNITDVDDKTIRDSQKENKTLKKFTEFYTKEFLEDINSLNIEKADIMPKATETIKEIVLLVKKLLDKRYAYKSADGCIYYKISKFKDYGKLSHLKIKELKAGARVAQDEYEKESASDFALWKSYSEDDGDVFWETELGKGRPGWHIECSAMSMKFLGESFDIHTGGVDLVFPHNENEIAQSEAATGKKFVNFWVHNEHLIVDGKKMSKSLGNFYTLRDLLNKGYDAKTIRYELLSTHYRQKLNLTMKSLDASKNAVRRLNDFILKIKNIKTGEDNKKVDELIKELKTCFEKAMDDDLDISKALASVFEFVKEINKLDKIGKNNAKNIISSMQEIDSVIGVMNFKEEKIDKEIEKLIEEREKARKNKDYALADRIRDELKEKGIILEDTKEGVRWKKL